MAAARRTQRPAIVTVSKYLAACPAATIPSMTGHVSTRIVARRAATDRRILSERMWRILVAAAIWASVAGIFFAIPHTTEDFVYHVPRSRFHLNDEFSLWLWAGIAALQVAGIALASARNRLGFVLLAATGVIWGVATVADHAGDVFLRQPWREAPSSTIWAAGTVLANLAAAGIACVIAASWRRDEPRRR